MDNLNVGVIVGRFMIHDLHEGHESLFEQVLRKHSRVLLFLGLPPLRNTINNPLDYRSRRTMINERYPDVEVHYIDDVRNDTLWSANLDRQITKAISPNQKAILYGSRHSFIDRYNGRFECEELESEVFISATEIRRKVGAYYRPTKDYRAGLIAASTHRFPTAYQTVDVAVFSEDYRRVLLARKPEEKQWRLIGGFSSPESDSLEDDAKREVMEEASVEIGDICYITSKKIDDWRYKNEQDCVKTALFASKYLFGRPEGGDDVAEVKWFNISELSIVTDIVIEHRPLFELLSDFLCKKLEGKKDGK